MQDPKIPQQGPRYFRQMRLSTLLVLMLLVAGLLGLNLSAELRFDGQQELVLVEGPLDEVVVPSGWKTHQSWCGGWPIPFYATKWSPGKANACDINGVRLLMDMLVWITAITVLYALLEKSA